MFFGSREGAVENSEELGSFLVSLGRKWRVFRHLSPVFSEQKLLASVLKSRRFSAVLRSRPDESNRWNHSRARTRRPRSFLSLRRWRVCPTSKVELTRGYPVRAAPHQKALRSWRWPARASKYPRGCTSPADSSQRPSGRCTASSRRATQPGEIARSVSNSTGPSGSFSQVAGDHANSHGARSRSTEVRGAPSGVSPDTVSRC